MVNVSIIDVVKIFIILIKPTIHLIIPDLNVYLVQGEAGFELN